MRFIPGIINAVRITQQDGAVPFSVFVFNPSVSTATKQAQRDSYQLSLLAYNSRYLNMVIINLYN